MSVITLLTDFGEKDHYVASLKAKLYSLLPDHRVFDVSHQVKKYHISHAAFLLNQVYHEYPVGSIHIIDVGSQSTDQPRFLLAEIDDHFFIGPDNGILSILTSEKLEKVVDLGISKSTFPAKDLMVDVAAKLVYTPDISKIADTTDKFVVLKRREVKITDTSIHGNVIHVDDYGNLITNIQKDHFDAVSDNRSTQVKFRFEVIEQIVQNYGDVDGGEIAVFFNDLQLLEIAINQGNAKQLLGLKYDTPITIEFGESSLF